MKNLSEIEEKAVQDFRKRLFEVFPDEIHSVQIFGSAARGESEKDSDIDLLISMIDFNWQDEQKIIDLATEISLETDVDISPKIFKLKRLEEMKVRHNMFWQSIQGDLLPV